MKQSLIFIFVFIILIAAFFIFRGPQEANDGLGDIVDNYYTDDGLFAVDSIELIALESFPVQINAVVRGVFSTSCGLIGAINQIWEDGMLKVEMRAVHQTDAVCAQVITEHEETVPLIVDGLSAGTYGVDINGISDTFTLEQDNILIIEDEL